MACITDGRPCPLRFEILGSGVAATKLKSRLLCALGGLGWTANVAVNPDSQRALDLGVRRDPVLLADGSIFMGGLPRTEEIEARLRACVGAAPSGAGTDPSSQADA